MPWQRYDGNQQQKPQPKPKPIYKEPKVSSDAKVTCVEVKGGTTSDCVNTPVNISALRTGAIAKIPVVLAELTIQVNVGSIITFPEPILEIKDIKKKVKITQCLLIQDTNMLFIKGFVRKNIDYSSRKCSTYQGVCGDIKHCTVDIPFSCTTPVSFNGIEPLPPIPNTSSEFEYLRTKNLYGPQFAEKDKLMSGDFSEFNKTSIEYFNELPFCELMSAKIVEFDEQLNPIHPKDDCIPFEEREFRKIEEKMVIFLTLKLLQKRQVAIGAIGSIEEDC